MSNPLRILRTLDHHLTLPVEMTLFGRSALALGYSNASNQFHSTQDVDGILPLNWLAQEEAHEDFWQAVQQTNIELESDGLYLTHLFRETDIILRPDWLIDRVSLKVQGLSKLIVFRPSAIDLVLTKMARGDEDDLQDIRFLIEQDFLTEQQLNSAFALARIPAIAEIQELFERSRSKVLAFAKNA